MNEFNLESPAGLIGIQAEMKNDKVTHVTFKNVPAFAVYLDKEIEVPHLGHGVEKLESMSLGAVCSMSWLMHVSFHGLKWFRNRGVKLLAFLP